MMSIKTILVVENDPVSLSMYRKRLEREGFRVECAQDGLEATTMLSDDPPDLVLLDLMLPKLNGSMVLEFMHADPRLTTIPVIILSNAPMTEVPPDSPIASGTRRLVKGECTFATLLQAIQETLADSPEFVVVEAAAGAGASSPASGNGQVKSNGSGTAAPPNPPPVPNKRRIEFIKAATSEFPKIRENCLAYIKAPSSPTSQVHLSGLHQRIQLLSSNAAQVGCSRLARLASAFDSLLAGAAAKPVSVTPSVLQTIAQAVDCVGVLLKSDDNNGVEPALPTRVLIVDDDPVCNHVNVNSLKRANFDVTGVEDPITALRQLEANQFDLVVLDVNMPGITGFELCEKIRRLPHCRTIPVIFVTAFSNFDNRKQSVLSGGDDFVTKPVSPLELALKVVVHLVKARGQRARIPRPETNSARATEPSATNPTPATPFPVRVSERELQPMTSTETGGSGAVEKDDPAPPPGGDPNTPPPSAAHVRLAQPTEAEPAQSLTPGLTVPSTESANSNVETVTAPAAVPAVEELCAVGVPENTLASIASEQAATQPRAVEERHVQAPLQEIPAEILSELESARAAAKQAERARDDESARCRTLEQELTTQRRIHGELQTGFTNEQKAAAKLRREFEGVQAELQLARAESAKGRTDFEARLAELNDAKATAGKSEAALKEIQAAWDQTKAELASLRQAREELVAKVANHEEATAKAGRSIDELRVELQQAKAELEKVHAEFQRQSSEAGAAKVAAGTTEAALKEKEEWCRLLEEELAGLRQARDELQAKLANEQPAAAKLRADFEVLRNELQQARTEQEKVRADLEGQSGELKEVRAALAERENVLSETEATRNRMREELDGLRQTREELQSRLAAEQQAAAKSRQESSELQELVRQSKIELDCARADLQGHSAELAAVKSLGEEKDRALKETETWNKLLEEELAGLRRAQEDLQARFTAEEQTSAKLRRVLEQLEAQSRQNSSELGRLRADHEKHSAELAAANALAEERDKALCEKETWCGLLEEELAGLRRAHEELQNRITAGEQSTAALRQENEQLREQVQSSQTELEQARMELRRQSAERMQIESEYQAIADTAGELRGSLVRLHEMLSKKPSTAPAQQSGEESSTPSTASTQDKAVRTAEREEPRETVRGEPVASPKLAERAEPARPAEPAASPPAIEAARSPDFANGQTFRLAAPAARTVLLTGDFTDWRERAIPMQNNDGLWTATVKLAPGTYHYLFLVDDQWRDDPECSLRAANSVGGYNMVRRVA